MFDSRESSLRDLNRVEFVIVSPSVYEFPKFLPDIQIRHVTDQRKGIYEALNLGVVESRGDYVIVVNTDDFVDVVSCLKAIDRHSMEEHVAIFGDTEIIDDTSDQRIFIAGVNPEGCLDKLRMPGSHQAQLIKKDEFLRLNLFRTSSRILGFQFPLKFASDFDFFVRSHHSGGKWIYDSRIRATQRLGGSTSQHWLRTTFEICLLHWQHGNKKLYFFDKYFSTLVGASKFHLPRQKKRKRHRHGK